MQLASFDAALAMSQRTSIDCSAFTRRATIAKLHLIVMALLLLISLESARAADGNSDECGLASVYSTLSEETASGQDTCPCRNLIWLAVNRESGDAVV